MLQRKMSRLLIKNISRATEHLQTCISERKPHQMKMFFSFPALPGAGLKSHQVLNTCLITELLMKIKRQCYVNARHPPDGALGALIIKVLHHTGHPDEAAVTLMKMLFIRRVTNATFNAAIIPIN